jgi:hypothetical protein
MKNEGGGRVGVGVGGRGGRDDVTEGKKHDLHTREKVPEREHITRGGVENTLTGGDRKQDLRRRE